MQVDVDAIKASLPQQFLDERKRQIEVEGYTDTHDLMHDNGELLAAAVMYWQRAIGQALPMRTAMVRTERPSPSRFRPPKYSYAEVRVPVGWPWEPEWWKPKTPQRDLERAGALCLAEIERLASKSRPIGAVVERLQLIVSAYGALD